MARKTTKLCPVCGNEFKGTDGKITCSNACRTAASRMLAKGKKPEFWIMAKTKGQKLPLVFNGPKPAAIKPKKEDFGDVEKLTQSINYVVPIPELYDSPPKAPHFPDEACLTEPVKDLPWEKKWAHNDEIDKKIKELRDRPLPPGAHPKTFKLTKDDKIAELEKQKIKM